MKQTLYRFFLSALLGLAVSPGQVFCSDDAVVAVLTTRSGPYQQALEGFQQAFGHPVPSYALSDGEPKIPSGTRIIVAIGGSIRTHQERF